MGDRTNIADALMCLFGGTLPPGDSVPQGHYWDGGFYHCPCGAIVEWESDDRVAEHQDARVTAALPVLDAAGYDVVLRADPDTNDDTGRKGVLRNTFHDDGTMTAEVLTAPDTSDERTMLDYTATQLDANYTGYELAVVLKGLQAERDAERAARERAEAEARQLRAERDHLALIVGDLWDHPPSGRGETPEEYAKHLSFHWGYLVMQVWRRLRDTAADADGGDGGWVLAAVAEGAEDRGQTA